MAVAFIAAVVLSARSASVPVGAIGATGAMPGMAMPMQADRLELTMRDLEGRAVALPGGRAGIVVFADTGDCAWCVASVRAARDAVQEAAAPAQLIVVLVDATTTREEVALLARSVGRSPARYVIDDRDGSLASTIGFSGSRRAIVYDRSGRVVARPGASSRQLSVALRRAQPQPYRDPGQ